MSFVHTCDTCSMPARHEAMWTRFTYLFRHCVITSLCCFAGDKLLECSNLSQRGCSMGSFLHPFGPEHDRSCSTKGQRAKWIGHVLLFCPREERNSKDTRERNRKTDRIIPREKVRQVSYHVRGHQIPVSVSSWNKAIYGRVGLGRRRLSRTADQNMWRRHVFRATRYSYTNRNNVEGGSSPLGSFIEILGDSKR